MDFDWSVHKYASTHIRTWDAAVGIPKSAERAGALRSPRPKSFHSSFTDPYEKLPTLAPLLRSYQPGLLFPSELDVSE